MLFYLFHEVEAGHKAPLWEVQGRLFRKRIMFRMFSTSEEFGRNRVMVATRSDIGLKPSAAHSRPPPRAQRSESLRATPRIPCLQEYQAGA